MPSLSRSLEQVLHRAIKLASDRHHEYATLEHLLLALLDDPDAAQVMKACNVDLDALRRSLLKYVDHELLTLVIEDGETAAQTFSRQLTSDNSEIFGRSDRGEKKSLLICAPAFCYHGSHARQHVVVLGEPASRKRELREGALLSFGSWGRA